MEVLAMKIATEYRKKALLLPDNGLQDIGERRKLRIELQKKCGIAEVVAINILNGMYLDDYVAIEKLRAKEKSNED